MPTLYRKYRPQKFEDIVGQEHIAQTIKNEISAGQPAHAFLFSGPRGVGKTTLARLLAKALNCERRKNGSPEPCDECSSCLEITAGRNIDVIEIDAATNTQVDKTRENIIENAAFKPTRSPYKIFIIDEVHMLSDHSFNALLKTIEEPPAHVIFILATTEFGDIPDTIVSRCQRFNFKKIPAELIIAKLKKIASEEDIKVDKEVLELVAVKSGGCLRDAESLFGQILSLDLKKITLEATREVLPSGQLEEAFTFIKNAQAARTDEMISAIQEISKNGTNPETWVDDILQVLRLALITKTGFQPEQTALLTKQQNADLKNIAERAQSTALIAAIDKTILRAGQIRNAVIPELPLEILAVELVGIFNQIIKEGGGGVVSPISPSLQEGAGGAKNAPNSNANINLTERPQTTKTAPSEPPVAVEAPSAVIANSLQGVAQRSHEESLKAILPHSAPTTIITPDTATAIWNKMIETVGVSNMSLTFILKMATVEKIEGNTLTLNIPYSFHKAKLEEPKSRQIILDALSVAGGVRLNLCYTIKTETAAVDTSAQDLALQFGGEVVG